MFPTARRLGTAALIASLVGACGGRDAATFDKDAQADVPAVNTAAKRPAPVFGQASGTPKVVVDLK